VGTTWAVSGVIPGVSAATAADAMRRFGHGMTRHSESSRVAHERHVNERADYLANAFQHVMRQQRETLGGSPGVPDKVALVRAFRDLIDKGVLK
jgi:hypothetical protein